MHWNTNDTIDDLNRAQRTGEAYVDQRPPAAGRDSNGNRIMVPVNRYATIRALDADSFDPRSVDPNAVWVVRSVLHYGTAHPRDSTSQ